MNLYLISQNVNSGYDTYDSAVVCAESEERARFVNPDGSDDWDGKVVMCNDGTIWDDWCNAEDVQVEYIGKAKEGVKGVVCTSFNAG